MGASSSVNTKELNEFIIKYYDEEYKDVDDSNNQRPSFTTEDIQSNSSVWFTINAIISSILVIKSDLHSENNTTIGNEDDYKESINTKTKEMQIVIEVLTKIMINIDSIHNIQNTTFEYGKLEAVDERKTESVKNTLKTHYGMNCLVIINNPKQHTPVNLTRFTYGMFEFIVDQDKLHVYV